MKKIKTRNKILISILFIICLFLLKNGSKVNAASYIWPVGGSNYGETYIEYGYGQRYYDSNLYNTKYPYGTPEQYFKNTIAENHFGVDIVGIKGNTYSVVSVANGTVIETSADYLYSPGLNFIDRNLRRSSYDGGGYGNFVIIQETSTGRCFLYGHLRAGTITVRKGSKVTVGQQIATMGSSGDSGHMHLHFEVRKSAATTITNGGTGLVSTTGYGIQTENPVNYIGTAPVVKRQQVVVVPVPVVPDPEPDPTPEQIVIPAKRSKITFKRYNDYRQINIYYNKPVTVEKAPTVTVKIGDETLDATYVKTMSDDKILVYKVDYENIDMFTSGTMYISCNNDGIIKNKEDGETLVECKFKNVKIGELHQYKIANTHEDILNSGLGDLNKDGRIDSVDASLVYGIYSKLSTGEELTSEQEDQKTRADVNLDGYVDSIDASMILSYYIGLATGLTNIKAQNIIRCDLDKDKVVNVNDYTILKSAIENGTYDEKYDLNKDEVLNSKDIEYFKEIMLISGRRSK